MTAEEFSPYLDMAANSLSKDMEVQGFRKGHVPRNIVEQKLGSSALYNEAADLAVKATHQEALKGHKGDSLAVPEVRVVKLAPGNPFVYKIIFFMPYFEIAKNYRNIAKHAFEGKNSIVVDEKEVEDTLKWLAENNKAAKGKGKDDEKKSVEINDEFAKSLGNFNNLEELKKNIKEGITQEKEKREKDRIRLKIVKDIASKSSIDIPENVIDNEILKIEDEFAANISQMGLEFEDYLKKINKTKDELRQGWKEQAKDRIEMSLVLSTVSENEDIKPEESEVEEESSKVLKQFKSIEEAEKNIDPARLHSYVYGILKNEKTLNFLESL